MYKLILGLIRYLADKEEDLLERSIVFLFACVVIFVFVPLIIVFVVVSKGIVLIPFILGYILWKLVQKIGAFLNEQDQFNDE